MTSGQPVQPAQTIQRAGSSTVMSQAVIHNHTIYLAGQVALDQVGAPFDVQFSAILGRIDDLLGQAGSHRRSLLSVTIWLSDIADFDRMNAIYAEWLGRLPAPARTTVGGVTLAVSGLAVEVSAIAAAESA